MRRSLLSVSLYDEPLLPLGVKLVYLVFIVDNIDLFTVFKDIVFKLNKLFGLPHGGVI